MILNENFDKKIEPLINSSYALTDWFERNQDAMAYFELTKPNCLHFEDTSANIDIKVLGRMASNCLSYLESDLPYIDKEKVAYAIISINTLYNAFKERLSEEAKNNYYINTDELLKARQPIKRR